MSGGAIVVAPAALVLVPAVAIGAGAVAALTIQAARAGTQATGRALEGAADEMARVADAQDDLARRSRMWELAAASAVATNRDLCLLAARAEHAGVQLPLPPPIDLTGCRLADIRGLVARAQESVARLHREVERAEAASERRTLVASLPVPPDGSPSAAELLARHQQVLARRRTGARLPEWTAPSRIDEADLRVEIEAILARVDGDATREERATVLLAAAQAAKPRSAALARTYLDALARIVQQEVNPRAASRREAATLLAAIEQPLVAAAIEDQAHPRPPFFDAVQRLRSVVRGDADLTPADRRDADRLLCWAQEELDRRRLLATVAETFERLGYTVTTGIQTRHTGEMSVTRTAWHGDYTADVWLDDTGQVHSRLVQLTRGAGAEARRCTELNDTLQQVAAELDRRGTDAQVNLPDPHLPALRRFGSGTGSATSTPWEEATRAPRAMNPDEENE